MKNWLLFLFCLCSYFGIAQTESIPFQTILTDSEDAVLNNISAELQVDILQNSQTGSVVYSEIHDVISGNNGEIYLTIGTGDPLAANFDEVDWSKPNYIDLSVKPSGFSTFYNAGTRQLLSVPYAIFALKVSCADGCPGETGQPGDQGADGPIGPTGFVGPAGPAGATGATGQRGVDGAQTLTITDMVPDNPSNNEFYIDDGTNRADGLPGIRFFNGTDWLDI